MIRPLTLALAPLLFAPADAARAADTGTGIAEIVHFRLADGVTEARFLEATSKMQPLVEAAPGYVSRHLSKNDDGSWTDYLVWTDLEKAEAAAASILSDPKAEDFGQAIDATSVEMRHETIMMQME